MHGDYPGRHVLMSNRLFKYFSLSFLKEKYGRGNNKKQNPEFKKKLSGF